MKITRNYAACQNAVSNAKHTEKNISTLTPAAGKARRDAIRISGEGAKKSGASTFAAALSKSMEEGAPANRIAALKQQVQEGTYEVSAEQIARHLMSSLRRGERIGRDHLFLDRAYGSAGDHGTKAGGRAGAPHDERAG